MKMKKLFSSLMALGLVATMAACGNTETAETPADTTTTIEEPQTVEEKVEKEAAEEAETTTDEAKDMTEDAAENAEETVEDATEDKADSNNN